MITGHGDDQHRYQQNIRADFSSNVIPGAINEKLIAHLNNVLTHLNHYPEPDAESLAIKLAAHHLLSSENILVTNGSVEAFYLVSHYFQEAQSVVYCPSFAEYEDACRMYQHNTSFHPINEFGLSPVVPGSVHWLGNPNNPDGKITSLEKIKSWLVNHPDSFLVIDEAYASLCSGFESAVPLLSDFKNLIIIRSFTKTFAIPGLRLGYLLASSDFISKLKELKMPWSVNQLAIEAGKFILNHYEMMLPDLSTVLADAQQLQAAISQLPGFRVIPSATNYFLLETQKGTGTELKAFLLEKHGILIRDAGNFRLTGKNTVRIAVQQKEENQLLINALKEWISCF